MKSNDPMLDVFLKHRLVALAYAHAGAPDARSGVDCEDSHFIGDDLSIASRIPPDPRLG